MPTVGQTSGKSSQNPHYHHHHHHRTRQPAVLSCHPPSRCPSASDISVSAAGVPSRTSVHQNCSCGCSLFRASPTEGSRCCLHGGRCPCGPCTFRHCHRSLCEPSLTFRSGSRRSIRASCTSHGAASSTWQ